MNLQAIAARANVASRMSRRLGAPLLSPDSGRDVLLSWLAWNDPNGCYTDLACEQEDCEPLTTDDAWELIAQATEDFA